MSSQEANSTPFARSFTLQEFDRLLTSALDIDRVPLPLINFAPSRSSPASLEWTTDLDSYVDDQHDIDALEKPFLNLDGLAIDLGKPQSPPTLLRRVKSRASALVRRGKDDSQLPPVTEIDFEDFVEPPPPVRVRTKSLPLPAFSSRKSKDPSPSVEPHVRRTCHSFIEHSVSHNHFWRRSLPLHSPSISFAPRPTPRLQSSSLQFEDVEDQSASPPFLNPRTPPMPRPGLPLYEPNQTYLGTRRGSTTSTNSSLSSAKPTPSVKSSAGSLASRITSSLSRLAQRSRSKISLTLDTEIEFADSPPSATTASHSPRTPISPFANLRLSHPASPAHQSGFPDVIAQSNVPGNDLFPMDRVLTPEPDPFARASCVFEPDTDRRSSTPTPYIFSEKNSISSYTFPSQLPSRAASRATSTSDKNVPTRSTEESSRLVRPKYAPPPFPPPLHPPPRYPPPVRPLPPTPSPDNDQTEFCDWTLNLDSPTGAHFKDASDVKGRSDERRESSKQSMGLLSPRNRPSSPFPLLKNSSSSKSLLQALAPSVTYRARSNTGRSTDSDASQSQKRTTSVDTVESTGSSVTLRARPLFPNKPRAVTPPIIHGIPSTPLSPAPDCTVSSIAMHHEFAVAKDDSSPIQPAAWRTPVLYDDVDEDLRPFRSSGGVRSATRDSFVSTMSSDRASFHTAISSMSVLSMDNLSENTMESAYSWDDVHVTPSSGDWDIWVPGAEGYLEGEEGSQIKIASKTWGELMEFCFAHDGVVVRKRSIPGDDEVTVLNVEVTEARGGGLEMVLTLARSRMRVETSRQLEGTLVVLAFSTPLPTTLGLLAHHCRGASVGQGVAENDDTNVRVF